MDVERREATQVPVAVTPIMPVRAFSGWKMGFAAGISFTLTLLVAAGLYFGMRAVGTAMEESRQRSAERQSHSDDAMVNNDFRQALRSLADALEGEAAVLNGPPEKVKAAEAEIEVRDAKVTEMAKTAHERQIMNSMFDVHYQVENCLDEILSGNRPFTPPSTCSAQVKSKAEIEKAVNTPYTQY